MAVDSSAHRDTSQGSIYQPAVGVKTKRQMPLHSEASLTNVCEEKTMFMHSAILTGVFI